MVNEAIKEATVGQVVEFGKDSYEIIEIEAEKYQNLKADLIKRGFDGKVYKLRRILKGRQRKVWYALAYRGTNGIFASVAGGHSGSGWIKDSTSTEGGAR